jgi:hypothetical protein
VALSKAAPARASLSLEALAAQEPAEAEAEAPAAAALMLESLALRPHAGDSSSDEEGMPARPLSLEALAHMSEVELEAVAAAPAPAPAGVRRGSATGERRLSVTLEGGPVRRTSVTLESLSILATEEEEARPAASVSLETLARLSTVTQPDDDEGAAAPAAAPPSGFMGRMFGRKDARASSSSVGTSCSDGADTHQVV